MISLSRDPNIELGDSPPWLKDNAPDYYNTVKACGSDESDNNKVTPMPFNNNHEGMQYLSLEEKTEDQEETELSGIPGCYGALKTNREPDLSLFLILLFILGLTRFGKGFVEKKWF